MLWELLAVESSQESVHLLDWVPGAYGTVLALMVKGSWYARGTNGEKASAVLSCVIFRRFCSLSPSMLA